MKLFIKNDTKSSGFTLFELMIVIGILTILGAVSFPMINASLPKYRLRATVRELVINFKRAKVEAIKLNKVVLIQFTKETIGNVNAGGSYKLCVDDNSNDTCETSEILSLTSGERSSSGEISMEKGVRLNDTTFKTPDHITGYTGRGIPWNSQLGSVTIGTADASRSYTITLSANGAVTM